MGLSLGLSGAVRDALDSGVEGKTCGCCRTERLVFLSSSQPSSRSSIVALKRKKTQDGALGTAAAYTSGGR